MTRALLALVGAVAIGAALACSTGESAAPELAAPLAPVRPRAPAVAADPRARPQDVAELFETKILPTCSVNGGVCHNSSQSPDLRNLAALRDLVDRPCGTNAGPEAPFPDACEPPGDRLVAAGVDVEILRVDADASSARLALSEDVAAGALGALTIRRGELVFDASANGVTFTREASGVLRARLTAATPEAKIFFAPQLPLREDRIWPADVNGNGVAGARLGWRQIVPGLPELSYLVARLWDDAINPELMPRQCRTWNDAATLALACWIEGLRRDDRGQVTNFEEPIAYDRCTFQIPRSGRCEAATAN